MTITTQSGLDLITQGVLNSFDTHTHIAFGSDSTAEDINDTTLGTELLRKAFSSASVKDLGNGTYEFSGRVTLGELNSSTINELGILDASSGGNLGVRHVTSSGITKTDADELIIKLLVTVVSTNN